MNDQMNDFKAANNSCKHPRAEGSVVSSFHRGSSGVVSVFGPKVGSSKSPPVVVGSPELRPQVAGRALRQSRAGGCPISEGGPGPGRLGGGGEVSRQKFPKVSPPGGLLSRSGACPERRRRRTPWPQPSGRAVTAGRPGLARTRS